MCYYIIIRESLQFPFFKFFPIAFLSIVGVKLVHVGMTWVSCIHEILMESNAMMFRIIPARFEFQMHLLIRCSGL